MLHCGGRVVVGVGGGGGRVGSKDCGKTGDVVGEREVREEEAAVVDEKDAALKREGRPKTGRRARMRGADRGGKHFAMGIEAGESIVELGLQIGKRLLEKVFHLHRLLRRCRFGLLVGGLIDDSILFVSKGNREYLQELVVV